MNTRTAFSIEQVRAAYVAAEARYATATWANAGARLNTLRGLRDRLAFMERTRGIV